MTTEVTKDTIYVRKTAYCPNCGTESGCYYSILEDYLTIICNKCKMTTQIKQVKE